MLFDKFFYTAHWGRHRIKYCFVSQRRPGSGFEYPTLLQQILAKLLNMLKI